MPYLCWIYNDGTQQDFIGVNTCAVDMLYNLPTDKHEMLLIAHSSGYVCRFILKYLEHVKPIVKSNRFLQIKSTLLQPNSKTKTTLKHKYSYMLVSMPLT